MAFLLAILTNIKIYDRIFKLKSSLKNESRKINYSLLKAEEMGDKGKTDKARDRKDDVIDQDEEEMVQTFQERFNPIYEQITDSLQENEKSPKPEKG